MNSILP